MSNIIPSNFYEGIGGSTCAAIMGLDSHKTPYDAWLMFTDPESREDLADNEPVLWGQLLERAIGEEAARRFGIVVEHQPELVRHPTVPFLQAHVDFRVVGEPAILECKNRGLQMMKQYDLTTEELEDEDRVLATEAIQVHHYLTVTGAQKGYLAVLIGGQKLLRFVIQRDERVCATIIERCTEFWRYVQRREPPPPVNVADCHAIWKSEKPGKIIEADATLMALIEQRKSLKTAIKNAAQSLEIVEFGIKSRMQDAEEVMIGGRRALTWKKSRDGTELDPVAVKMKHPDVWEECQSERIGPRVMR